MNEKDTQTQKGQASEDTDVSAKETAGLEAEKQTSDGKGTTSSSDATNESLLTTIFAIPGRPDLKLTGQEVANSIGRAELASKFQGDADKATAEKQTALERAVQAEAKLAAFEEDNRLVEKLESAGLLPRPSASKESTDSWVDEEPAESQLGAKEVARIVDDITRQTADTRFDDIDTKIEAAVGKRIQTERDGEQQLRQYEDFMVAEGRARRASLRQDYPSASDDRIEEIAILHDSAQKSWTAAQKAAAEGDSEVALQKVQERDAYSRRSTKLEAEAMVAQGTAEKKAEYEQQLETGDFAGVELPEELSGDKERKPIFDPEEKKKRRDQIRDYVANLGIARGRAKTAQGE